MPIKNILVLNAGSATLKWALFSVEGMVELGRGVIERIGERGSFAEWRLQGQLVIKQLAFKNHQQAVAYIVKMLSWHHFSKTIGIVGHRIVHGGPDFDKPILLTPKTVAAIKCWQQLAPLHDPVELLVAQTASKLFRGAKHVAVFDTAWFINLPVESQIYALPFELNKKYNIRRYGFHGLSHQFVSQQAAKLLKKPLEQLNIVSCHLGSGCSVAAVRAGKPIDVSMGFTPLEGLVMGTRAGDIDAGLILHLLHQKGVNLKKLTGLLNAAAGLKGLAGVSDMREILVRAGYEVLGYKKKKFFPVSDIKRAKLALRVFIYRLQKYIGAYAAILGRVDAIVFTGGMGERNEIIRNLTMQDLPTLKSVTVLPIATNEELAIARQIVDVN